MWSAVSLGTGRVGPWVLAGTRELRARVGVPASVARESGCGHEGGVRKWAWPLYDAGRMSGRGCGLVMAASWPWLRGPACLPSAFFLLIFFFYLLSFFLLDVCLSLLSSFLCLFCSMLVSTPACNFLCLQCSNKNFLGLPCRSCGSKDSERGKVVQGNCVS